MSVSLNTLSTSKQDKLTAGTGISISGATISCTVTAPTNYVKTDNGNVAIGSFIYGHPKPPSTGSTSVAAGNTTGSLYGISISTNTSDDYVKTSTVALSGTWRNVGGGTSVGYASTKNSDVCRIWQRIS